MKTFKVICKAEKDEWVTFPTPTKIVKKKLFFGLFSKEITISEPEKRNGPSKYEVCIVFDQYWSAGEHYYRLKGYGESGYVSKYFIRIDEFTEAQKEIAEKSQPIFN